MEDLKEDFYLDCAKKLRDMTEEEFMITQKIFQDLYAMKCMEYRILSCVLFLFHWIPDS